MVDWSGGNDTGKSPRQDAIWACVARLGRAEDPFYLRNRRAAEHWLAQLFAAETQAGRRVLAGFDFPFGYPAGFAQALTGHQDPFALWDWLEERIEDSPTGNNRFDVAADVNQRFGGHGPFWFNGLKREIAGLPRRKATYENPFEEKRRAEHLARGAFSCWQLGGTGAVGSQVLMGLPVLSRLRRKFDAAVWPFDTLDKAIAFVEIWPSLTLGPAPPDQIKDAWQVREVARTISSLMPRQLETLLDVAAPEEGWIFGVGFEDVLRQAARQPPHLTNDCFALPPGVHWTPVQDALEALKERLTPVVGIENRSVTEATGRVLAADAVARRANPPLPNTAVDGYGFAGGRDAGVHHLPLAAERAAAGDAPGRLPDGHAMRILTGAALPAGVDTVVLQEDVTVSDGQIAFRGPVRPGANTRQAGEDMQEGAVAVAQGVRVGPAEAALLAAVGARDVAVYKPLRVAILSTGAELVEAGDHAAPGQIYDANRPMLLEMVRQFGHHPVDMGRVLDDRGALRDRLDQAAAQADVILTSGGASAGDEDHVSAVLREAGALTLWRIAVKPGRPLALGFWSGVPVFGLPGNPVAAMVCALIFARPAMARLAGQDWLEPQGFGVPAAFSKNKKAGRSEFLRARMKDGRVEVFPSEGSGRISGLSWAEGLVELPPEAAQIVPGSLVRYIPFGSFGLR
ncbi:molybdopterin molybdenumtransferase MoeA [Roseobacter sp. YSTF-M11]|uniref:Molybdopterin molybdenumtransferase n=1 Tax=Roseobacter insulae TaxID=2859783 RepID=A0A9X1G016_9RHOB|nr:gephyrin-like molybdotransferase Glp [Roseobacter insulae]MBW4710567.1 molybdopterin molybdenumtransferase MoeA [Roseobacter insulae]